MKPSICSRLIAAAIATGLLTPGWNVNAATAVQSSLSTTTSSYPGLVARRLGFRFQVRPSRFRRGGFARGESCSQTSTLTPLTPIRDAAGNTLGGNAAAYLTAAAHPVFFFHVPDLPATTGKLTLQRPDLPLTQRLVYQTDFDLTGEAGIVGIRLPESAPSLEMGVEYVWQVSVACNPANREDSLTAIGGVVERVPDVTGTPTERLNFYRNQGIWQDTVTLMAANVHTSPADTAIASEFTTLLQEAGLDAIAHAPVIQIIEGRQ